MAPAQLLKVFLCHASDDKEAVEEVRTKLVGIGVDAWLDKDKLLAGQNWDLEIRQAIRSSDAIIVFLSAHSTTKAGYVQKEIRLALDVADEQPEGSIFMIPALLENCAIPERLKQTQWVDLSQSDGFFKLSQSLASRASSLGRSIVRSGFSSATQRRETWWGRWELIRGNRFRHGEVDIRKTDSDSFEFGISVISGSHVGDLAGRAKVHDVHFALFEDSGEWNRDGERCRLTFERLRDPMLHLIIRESRCLGYHGMGVGFDGVYQKTYDPLIESGRFSEAELERIYSLVGRKDYEELIQRLHLIAMDAEILDDTFDKVLTGGVRGMFTIYEGIVLITKSGAAAAAYLDSGTIHVFSEAPRELILQSKTFGKWTENMRVKEIL